ncbi:MAG: N-acetylmuramic acid 6-phosphate etherase [Bacteroidales bacterium]|jgi:N-acetylmuramic acid 6-phosphate etherase|nr:N-acetylmuramic acid 6-phosphate etherase [Bacteroidales bacterium]MDD3274043.1 N-acetylmuramic acid 6-phosphate etherase [Bacteroidales bacterium]
MKITEQNSRYSDLDKMATLELLQNMNREDKTVPEAVEKCIPQIEKIVDGIVERMKRGGRLFYLGAGTSGRLGILDASEIPPTFGAPFDLIIGLIAGGDSAIRRAVEAAEDNWEMGWNDMQQFGVGKDDVVIGIAASGTTPYVIGAVKEARKRGMLTGCITCNPNSPLSAEVDIPIEVVVGPEFVTGSTRMKSGTAQKLVLNMISTTAMIKLGRVKGNKMVDMQLTNAKLVERGTKMIMEEASISDAALAKRLLLEYGSVRKAVDYYLNSNQGKN